MGSLLSGSNQTSTSTTPWAPQAAQLQNIFSQAQTNYNNQAGTPWYQGELYAGLDPATTQAIGGITSYAQGQGANNANQLSSTGSALINPSNYQGALGAYFNSASTDPTQKNIADASAYANNPYLDSQVDAASRDVVRNLQENQLPGINQAAQASGNVNSTRAGVAQGIAQRGAQDQIGDISAAIRGNAYNTGLGLAQSANATNQAALGNSAGLYGSAVSQGGNLIGAGNQLQLGNLGQQVAAGQLNQANQQGIDNANLTSWTQNDQRQNQLLQQYYNIIGSNNWGQNSTSTQSSSPSILGAALGSASTISGLGGFGGLAKSLFG